MSGARGNALGGALCVGGALCFEAPLVGARGVGALGVGALYVGQYVVEYAADRQAYRRDRRMGTHVRFPS